MTDTAPNGQSAVGGDRLDSKPALTAHRAASVCAREFASVCDAVVQGATALHANGVADKPVIRRSPGRCIVQLGPVAMTVAWLRDSAGLIETGELLVIVWEGDVAPGGDHVPERAAVQRARTPTALWEQALTPAITSEATWWRPHGVEDGGYSSTDIAGESVERLRVEYAARLDAAPPTDA